MFKVLTKKQKILYIYLFFSTAFGLIIIYLLFFNFGLELKNPVSKGGKFFITLENSSTHKITNIKLYYLKDGQKNLILEHEELMPNESIEIPLEKEYAQNGKIRLIAEAPYHKTVLRELSLGVVSPTPVKLNISAPRAFFVGLKSEIKVEVCNSSNNLVSTIIVLEAPKSLIYVENAYANIKLPVQKCEVVKFSIKPLVKGDTTIYFNLVADNIAEKYPLKIVIYEAG